MSLNRWTNRVKLEELKEIVRELNGEDFVELLRFVLEEYERRLNENPFIRPKGRKFMVELDLTTVRG